MNFDKIAAYRKWKPVIESLKIKDEEIGKFASEIAEMFHFQSESKDSNLLPMNLKLLSQLNIKYRNYEYTNEDIEETTFDVPIPDDNVSGMDKLMMLDNKVIEIVSNYINEKLNSYDTIIINRLITELNLENANNIKVKGKFKFEERGNMFKVRQQVYDLLKEEFGNKFKYIKVDITLYEEKPSGGMSLGIATDSTFNKSEQ